MVSSTITQLWWWIQLSPGAELRSCWRGAGWPSESSWSEGGGRSWSHRTKGGSASCSSRSKLAKGSSCVGRIGWRHHWVLTKGWRRAKRLAWKLFNGQLKTKYFPILPPKLGAPPKAAAGFVGEFCCCTANPEDATFPPEENPPPDNFTDFYQ